MRNSVFFFCLSFVLLVYVVGELLFGSNQGGARPYWYLNRGRVVDGGIDEGVECLDFGVKLLEGEIEIEEEVEVVEVKHQLEDLSSEVMELHIDQTYFGGL